MIPIELLRENPSTIKASLRRRGQPESAVDDLQQVDAEWRSVLDDVQKHRSLQKQLSAERKIDAAKENKLTLRQLEGTLSVLAEQRQKLWQSLPNILATDVPAGTDESENVTLRTWGTIPKFSTSPADHLELGERLGIIDMERAAEVSGARFYYLKGDGALLEFALLHYGLSLLTNSEKIATIAAQVGENVATNAFVPVIPPVFIRPDVYVKMGRLQPGIDEDERYYLPADDQYLIGSAEHTLGPLHMNETLEPSVMPKRYVGFSTSFRREAGSYGKDTRGIFRVHQFDKLEMESFGTPEQGRAEHDFFVALQEALVQGLGLPYRVVLNCSGDIGTPNARQVDIECWLPSQERYRETHSADYMTDYQARRLNTKVAREGVSVYAHMNDGTALAMSRTIIAILENYQNPDGTVTVPTVLRPYMGKDVIDG